MKKHQRCKKLHINSCDVFVDILLYFKFNFQEPPPQTRLYQNHNLNPKYKMKLYFLAYFLGLLLVK